MNCKLLFSVFTIITFCFISCSDKGDDAGTLETIPEFTPKQQVAFNHTDSVYFDHLGYTSVALNNGQILIPDRNLPILAVVDKQGKLQKTIREGRGPGEILDAYDFVEGKDGKVYVYDQDNNKIIIFNDEMELVKEIIPPAHQDNFIIKIFPMANGQFLMQLDSFAYLEDRTKERELILVQYDPEKNTYGKENRFKAIPYARLILDGQVRGATRVEYAAGNIVSYHPENETVLLFDTHTDRIAEIDANFDTLRTIPADLPVEKVNSAERDTLEASYSMEEQWKTVKELLPDYKAPADKMMYCNNQIWLKTNHRSEYEKWLVLNMKGDILKQVHLPKESMLTHIDEAHLGVRLDDITFALFDNPAQ